MFCPRCGTESDPVGQHCSHCGDPLGTITQQDVPEADPTLDVGALPNYLVQAILRLFCCQPFAIVAIVFAAQVNAKLASGDFAGAQHSSDQARKWCWTAFGFGFIYIAFIIFLSVFSSFSEGS